MASTDNADGTAGTGDLASRLTEMSNRTNLMVIDATLRALPGNGGTVADAADYANAAAEVRALARRMLQATSDLQATLCEPAD